MKASRPTDVLFVDGGASALTPTARDRLFQQLPHHRVTALDEALLFLDDHSPMLVLFGCSTIDERLTAHCSLLQRSDPAGRCPIVLLLPEHAVVDADLSLPGVVGFITHHSEWAVTIQQICFVASAAARYRKFEWLARNENLARQAFGVMRCTIQISAGAAGECRAEESLLTALGLVGTLDSRRPFHWERLLEQLDDRSRNEFARQLRGALDTGEGWRYTFTLAQDRAEFECCGFVGSTENGVPADLTLAFRKLERSHAPGEVSANRHDPNDCLAQSINASAVGSVLLVRLENQQELRRSLGYGAYKQIVTAVMESIETCVRSSDLVLRAQNNNENVVDIGGAELLVTLEGVPAGVLLDKISKRIRHALRRPVSVSGISAPVRAVVGNATWPSDGDQVDDLLNVASQRIATRLIAHRGDQPDIEAAQQALALEADLYQALEKKELELHFQPKYRLDDAGAIVGAEALLRWHRGGTAWVPPDQFIPIAESNGLITTLGAWVIDEALRSQVRWREQGLGLLPVSINVSAEQLLQPDLVRHLLEACRRSNVPHDALEIEITESCLIDQPEIVIDVLQELKSLGFAIALDDFGTGYSSLSYLRTLPLDVLKIDRSFVQSLDGENYDPALTAGIIGLGLSLGLRIIAEGVETETQWRLLKEWGCHHAQGFLMSRPLPEDALAALLGDPVQGAITR